MVRNLNQLVELVAILWCMAALYGKKLKCGAYALTFLGINLIIFAGINEGMLPDFFMTLAYLSLFLYSLSYYAKGIKNTLVNCFLAIVIVGMLQMIFYLPVYFFLVARYGVNAINELVINICCFVSIIVLEKKIDLKELSEFFLRKNWLLGSISIFILICLSERLLQIKQYIVMTGEDYVQIICFLLLFALTISEWQKTKGDAERKKTQLEMNQLYYSAYDELLTVIRERQHDLKNHMNAIYGMIYTIDNYEELICKQKEYCQHMLDKSEETKILLSSGNPLLAGFLYQKIQEAEKQKIKVDYKISVHEIGNNISEYEIVEVLGILFDNAMEALSNRQDVEKKICVDIFFKDNQLCITVANNSEIFSKQKVNEFFQWGNSSKGKERGIGLAKLKKIVNQNEGEIIISNELYENDNFLKFCINIPLN